MEEEKFNNMGNSKKDYLVWAVLVLIVLNLVLIFLVGSSVFGSGYDGSNTRAVPENTVVDGEEVVEDIDVSDEEPIVLARGSCVLKSGFSCPEDVDKNSCESAGCVFELGGENGEINLCFPVICEDLDEGSCSGSCVWDGK